MLTATLLLQASLLAHPLYLEPEQPELHSAQHILLFHDELAESPFETGMGEKETIELMEQLRERVVAGESIGDLARQYSHAKTSLHDGSLGSYPEGLLREPFNTFLFKADMGELSSVLVDDKGVHLIQRVPTHAAVKMILLSGTGVEQRSLADRLVAELRGGADFAALAAEHSTDPTSKANGGRYHVFERGPNDASIKAAAFKAKVGEILDPIESPLGLHIMQRVEPDDFPRELWANNFIRVRGILVKHTGAKGAEETFNREKGEALDMAEEIIRRVNAGEESFESIAARFNDDPDGKERKGDLGWIHRGNPDLPLFLTLLFNAQPGTVSRAFVTEYGMVVLYRER